MMSGRSFLSPVVLDGPYLRQCDFGISEEAPLRGLTCDIDLHDSVIDFRHLDGSFRLVAEVDLSTALMEGEKERMHAHLCMRGEIAIDDSLIVDERIAQSYLRANAVSLFYAFARTHIEQLTSVSYMGRFTIPTIDPGRYVDVSEGQGGR